MSRILVDLDALIPVGSLEQGKMPEALRKAEKGQRLIVTRRGKPVAALVPFSDLIRLCDETD